MLRKLLVGATSTALLLGGASVAVAATPEKGPESQECTAAGAALKDGQAKKERVDKAAEALAKSRAEVAVLVTAYGIDFDVNKATAVDVEKAVAELRKLRDQHADKDLDPELTTPKDTPEDKAAFAKLSREMDIVKALRDALNEHGAAAEAFLAIDLVKLADAQKDACGEDKDEDRDEDKDEADKPAPTTSDKPAPFTDLDCKDFPLADGRTAQQVLDSTPDDDPHGLDADKDRIACEPGQDTAPDGSDIADRDEPGHVEEVAVPQGGVNTGGGPA